MKRIYAVYVMLVAWLSAVALPALATAPSYLSDGATAATTAFTDGMGVAVPVFYGFVIAVAIVLLLAKFIKRGTR